MFLNYLKITFRNLRRHKGYSFINIAGLAIGMSCCIFILLWIEDELSYESIHENAERVFRIESAMNFSGKGDFPSVWTVTPAQLAQALLDEYPEVKNAVRLKRQYQALIQHEQNIHYETKFYYASPSIFKIFTFSFLKGDPISSFQNPFSVVITEEISKKYFGEENPIGKAFILNKNATFTVTGIIKNNPHNSHLQIDFIAPFKACEALGERLDNWGRFDFPTYVLLRDGASQKEFGEKIFGYIKKHRPDSKTKFLLQPIKKIHLHSVDGNGNIMYIYLFSLIGFIILCIACINFLNLSTARSVLRGKEIGIRKSIGARRKELVKQLLSESTFYSFLAFILALLLVNLFLSSFNNLSGKEFTFDSVLNKQVLIGLICIVFFTGILAGSYPAFYLSSFHPINILKGSFRKGKNDSLLRKILVTSQFTISIILIVCTLVIVKQIHFIRNKNLGFNKDHILYVNLNKDIRNNLNVLKAELLKNPNIIQVAASDQVPVNQGNFNTISDWDGKNFEKGLMFHVMSIDHEYIDLLGLKINQGKKFRKEVGDNGIIVNEEAVRQMEMESPLGKKIHYWGISQTITGVIEDYHFKPLQTSIRPLLITNDPKRYNTILLKIRSENIDHTIDYLKQTFFKISPDYPFAYHFLDERIDSLYRSERRTGHIINWFTFLTIFTSSLGLFGLAAFTAQNRTKEIGIRKVLGASVLKIVTLLSSEFTKLVLLANLFAWPIGYYVMNKWLQNYVYKIKLNPWIFILSAISALIIALITVSYQSIKASIVNPVESLRNE